MLILGRERGEKMGAKTLLFILGPLVIIGSVVACAPQLAAWTEAPAVIETVEVPEFTQPPVMTEAPVETEPPPPTQPPATALPATLEPTRAPSPAELIQAEFTRMARGRILYNPPAEMTLGELERIEVRISQNVTEELTAGLEGQGEPRIEQIPVSSFMKVRLLGDNFAITPLSSEEQVVLGDTYSEWAWDVTPEKAGEQRLTLIVTARVKLAGFSDEQKDLDVIERQIAVQVNPGYAMRNFVNSNLNWIMTAIILPILVGFGSWGWRKYRKQSISRMF